MPDIHEHFCPFCGQWLGEGSALCDKCARPMCKDCIDRLWRFREYSGIDPVSTLLYGPAFHETPYRCIDCRTLRAESELASYRRLAEYLSQDPILWVAELSSQGYLLDLPRVDEGYDPIPGWLSFAEQFEIPQITIHQVDDTDSSNPVEVGSFTGWHVPKGVFLAQHAESYGESSGWHRYPHGVLVLEDGTWVSADHSVRWGKDYWQTTLAAPVRGNSTVYVNPWARHRDPIDERDTDIYDIRPEGFLQAAHDLTRPNA
jgi:hypothetical protein